MYLYTVSTEYWLIKFCLNSFSATIVHVARVTLDVDGIRLLSWLFFCSELSGYAVISMYTQCRRDPGQIKFCMYP